MTSVAEAAWEAGLLAMRKAQQEEARRKATEDQLRLLPRRVAVAEYLAAHPGRYVSLLEILWKVGEG